MFGLSRDRWSVDPDRQGHRRPWPAGCSRASLRDAPPRPGATSRSRWTRGVCHYTGVGVFTRPLSDLRAAGVRFVSEGLAFAIPPPSETRGRRVRREPARPVTTRRGSRPSITTPAARGTSRTCATTTCELLFGEDPALLRRHDPERALDLGRAAVAQVMAEAVAEWRRPASSLRRPPAGRAARPAGRGRVGGDRCARAAQGARGSPWPGPAGRSPCS